MAAPRKLPEGPDGGPEEAERSLRRLAEICAEAHAIVAREGPADIRDPLEALLRRVARQLARQGPGRARG